jgi:ketosteroid isomerase-like protein
VSQENVELVRRVWDAWERVDTNSVFALYAGDIEWTMFESTDYPADDPDIYRGHEGPGGVADLQAAIAAGVAAYRAGAVTR